MIKQVFYFELINDFMIGVVISPCILEFKNTYFYWDTGDGDNSQDECTHCEHIFTSICKYVCYSQVLKNNNIGY